VKPLIGITANRHEFDLKMPVPALLGLNVSDDYAHGIETAGGIPVVIPYIETHDSLEALALRLDGLVLAGGEDVNPELFGEEPKRGLGQVNPDRDALEVALIAEMVAQNKPILGICRGLQVLNAVFGGSLYQDVPREWKGHIQHSQRARRSHLSHTVHVEPGSRLHGLLNQQTQIHTNSFHHQAINKVGQELVPVAWDSEGLVEAIEHPGYKFLVAVQWHPENLWRTCPVFLGLFKGLVDAASTEV